MPSISNITKQYGGMKHGVGMKQKGGADLLGFLSGNKDGGENNKDMAAPAAPAAETAATPETAVAEGSQQSKEEPGLFDKLQNAVG